MTIDFEKDQQDAMRKTDNIQSLADQVESLEKVASTIEAADEEAVADINLPQERYVEMSASENLILTITENGAGKMSSSHDYPLRGRGGMGVQAMDKAMRGGQIVASFPIELEDQIMLVTSKGQSIRVPVEGISFRSRSAGGVKVFDTSKGEKVVSVAWIADQTAEDADVEDGGDAAPDTPTDA